MHGSLCAARQHGGRLCPVSRAILFFTLEPPSPLAPPATLSLPLQSPSVFSPLARSMCADGTLTVGVTSDSMLKAKSNANMVSSLSDRLEGVTDFLRCGRASPFVVLSVARHFILTFSDATDVGNITNKS